MVHNYGGIFTILPRFYFNQAPLWLCAFHKFSPVALTKYMASMLLSSLPRNKDATVKPIHVLDVDSVHGPAPYQVDGEWVGVTPVRIALTEEFVRLIYPVS